MANVSAKLQNSPYIMPHRPSDYWIKRTKICNFDVNTIQIQQNQHYIMHYFISAGEPSGDLHASALISELRQLDPSATFTFLGGDLMAQAYGAERVIHYRQMAFMGLSLIPV